MKEEVVARRTRRSLKRRVMPLRTVPVVELPNRTELTGEGTLAYVIESDESDNSEQKLCQQHSKKGGKFDSREQRILSDAVGEFLAIHQLKYDNFVDILQQKTANSLLRKQRFFQKVAKALPERSIASCYRFIKRNFIPADKKGAWTLEQKDRLIVLVYEQRSWQEIGYILGRSSECVYDKFKSMSEKREKEMWNLREFINLLLEVNKRAEVSFIDPEIIKERERETDINARQSLSQRERPYNSVSSPLPLIEMTQKYLRRTVMQLKLDKIPWSVIGKKVGRPLIQCKNKFMQVFEFSCKFFSFNQMELIDFLLREKQKEERDVKWEKWQNKTVCWREAKNRLIIMKKRVKERSKKSFLEMLAQLKEKALRKLGEK